jgi:hypothetical protein
MCDDAAPARDVTVAATPLIVAVAVAKSTPCLENDHRRELGSSECGTKPADGHTTKAGAVRPDPNELTPLGRDEPSTMMLLPYAP